MNDAKYIGLDVHQTTISTTVLDSTGKLVMESILETKAETILQFVRGLRGSLPVTFEEGICARLTVFVFYSWTFSSIVVSFRSLQCGILPPLHPSSDSTYRSSFSRRTVCRGDGKRPRLPRICSCLL